MHARRCCLDALCLPGVNPAGKEVLLDWGWVGTAGWMECVWPGFRMYCSFVCVVCVTLSIRHHVLMCLLQG
jgi:hypothetical protein